MQISVKLTLAVVLFVGTCTVALADESKADLAKAGERVSPSLVVVEYELQYDKADAPEGGLGAERCPNCGQYHGNNLRQYVSEERPVEMPGYLVTADRVVTGDPDLHPRFIKSISVRAQDEIVTATVAAYMRSERGILLELARPLKKAQPIKFEATKEKPAAAVNLIWQLGRWSTGSYSYSESVFNPDDPAGYRYTRSMGVAVTTEGMPQGLILDGFLPLGQEWQGSPLSWKMDTADVVGNLTRQLRESSAVNLLRVQLYFRSPKTAAGDNSYRYRSRGRGNDYDENITEANVVGVMLPENRILALANLDSKVTARLERILVYPQSGDPVTAHFSATLKDFGAFTATLETPFSGAVKTGRADFQGLRNQLLLRADVSLQGESRIAYFHTARISSFDHGPKQRVYPMLDGVDPEGVFLFDRDLQLLALAVQRRAPVSGERGAYASEETDLVPVAHIMEAVNSLPATADLANVPVSEEEENRLAWLGADLQPLNQELARANGVSAQTRDGETGALVTYVHPDSPAAKAGISPGDILLRLKVPGQPLPVEVHLEDDSMRAQGFPWDRLDEVPAQYFDRIPTPWSPVENNFIRSLTDLGFGTQYTAEIFANGQLETRELEVVSGPAHFESAPRFKSEALGITVRDLTYEVRRYLQRSVGEPGVVVSKIEPGGRAGVAGVRPYELITHINDQPVNSVKEFESLVAAKGELKLSMKRMSKGRIVTVTAVEN